MINELGIKSVQDEKRVNELNVTVENVQMNLSMQHRTVIGLIEDRKFTSAILPQFPILTNWCL